jgi:hypothetical protein
VCDIFREEAARIKDAKFKLIMETRARERRKTKIFSHFSYSYVFDRHNDLVSFTLAASFGGLRDVERVSKS